MKRIGGGIRPRKRASEIVDANHIVSQRPKMSIHVQLKALCALQLKPVKSNKHRIVVIADKTLVPLLGRRQIVSGLFFEKTAAYGTSAGVPAAKKLYVVRHDSVDSAFVQGFQIGKIDTPEVFVIVANGARLVIGYGASPRAAVYLDYR
jgi:hypothetical protein